jgi:hypothetical protein
MRRSKRRRAVMSIFANGAQRSHLIVGRHAAIQVKRRAKIKFALPSGGVLLVIVDEMREN